MANAMTAMDMDTLVAEAFWGVPVELVAAAEELVAAEELFALAPEDETTADDEEVVVLGHTIKAEFPWAVALVEHTPEDPVIVALNAVQLSLFQS